MHAISEFEKNIFLELPNELQYSYVMITKVGGDAPPPQLKI